MAKYGYYGAEHHIEVKNKTYKGIDNLWQLYEALEKAWDRGTCTSRLRDKWSEDNKTCGQCAITAFLVQDLCGGCIHELPLVGGGVHCYNVIDGVVVDLASEQFGEKAKDLDYTDNPIQDRAFRMQEPEKQDRYIRLKANLERICGLN